MKRKIDPHRMCRKFSELEHEHHAEEIRDRDSKIAALESANKALRAELEGVTMEGHALFLALKLTRERARRGKL